MNRDLTSECSPSTNCVKGTSINGLPGPDGTVLQRQPPLEAAATAEHPSPHPTALVFRRGHLTVPIFSW